MSHMKVNEDFRNRSMRQLLFLLSIVLSLSIFINGCDPDRVFEENKEIPEYNWKMNDPVQFKVLVKDTVSSHAVYVNIRNFSDYPYSNIYLFIHVISPTGAELTDTVNFLLADKRGKWLGRGLGDLYFLQLPYKQHIRFPYSGVYTFVIKQGMRTDLKGIRDVGLRVEREKTYTGGKK
ncbi:MAG TPA: gliding motility lipoprotein GldH [Bacteroidetes bacterium]|nr:gliding motility lipoprotein GldH [Bacteroidota bacterium]